MKSQARSRPDVVGRDDKSQRPIRIIRGRALLFAGGDYWSVIVTSRASVAITTLVVGSLAPASVLGWGAPGCTNLPEYERALGALQGMTSACDMSVERARRIVAAHNNAPGGLFGRLMSEPRHTGPDDRLAPH